MANPFLFSHDSHEMGTADTYLEFTSGASGAVPTALTRGLGILSVTRTTTGTYDVVLPAPYIALLGSDGSVIQASFSTGGACHVHVLTDAASNTTTAKVTIVTRKGTDFTAVDMASGDVLKLHLTLQYIQP